MISLETYDKDGHQRVISDAVGLQWSSQHGESGGGFGYLKFSLQRKVGHNYPDIGFGYRIILRKYMSTILFDGQIRQIQETQDESGDKIQVTALGHVVVAGDEEWFKVFSDTRLDQWKSTHDTPTGSIRPDKYTFGMVSRGLFIHSNSGADLDEHDRIELKYAMLGDSQYAYRIKGAISICLGNGIAFDATVSAIDSVNGYVDYSNDSGEANVAAGMSLYNSTKAKYATVSTINAGTNRIVVMQPGAISGWVATDEIQVYGPLFSAQILSVVDTVITYTGTIVGEANLSNGAMLVNITKKSAATIQSYNAGANTITATVALHLTDWAKDDTVAICASYFQGAIESFPTATTVRYTSPVGERIARTISPTTHKYVLHNVTRGTYASIQSWIITPTRDIVVTVAADISAWQAGDMIRTYTPFALSIERDAGTVDWPTDVRTGSVPQNRTAFDVSISPVANPTWRLAMEAMCGGVANDYSFAFFTDLKVVAQVANTTAYTLAVAAVADLSVAGHGLSTSTTWVSVAASKVLEPMVFEFTTISDALKWACEYGDPSGNLLAWGVKLDDQKMLYLESQSKSGANIGYIIKRDGSRTTESSGDLQESYQQVRGVYTNVMGERALTTWIPDTNRYFCNNYRRKNVQLSDVQTSADAIAAATLYLNDNKYPKRGARYTVANGGILNKHGLPIPADEVKAKGQMLLIDDWRGVESDPSLVDSSTQWTLEQLVAVEIDYDAGTASLIPASAISTFETYLKELARIASI